MHMKDKYEFDKELKSKMCEECYSDENRITPLLNPLDCLENHTQYLWNLWTLYLYGT